MKNLISLLALVSLTANAYDITLECSPWGTGNSFELSAELEESGSTYLDAYIDFKLLKNGAVIHNRSQVDSTGFYSLASVNRVQVYVAELRAINRSEFDFLSVAANHPIPSGNSVLTYQGEEFFAECTTRF